jgi:hypothetical protein
VSLILLEESLILVAEESAGFAVESAAFVSAPLLLQAAKAPIASTTKNFFILILNLLLTEWFRG